jgi:dihydroorotate dehydrogenase electron transfer subunit
MRNRVQTACLVAGGVGIAPLYLLAQSLLAQNVKPVLFYGGARADDLVLREYFERLGIEIFYTTEDGSFGERGVVTNRSPVPETNTRKNTRLCLWPWGMMTITAAVQANARSAWKHAWAARWEPVWDAWSESNHAARAAPARLPGRPRRIAE